MSGALFRGIVNSISKLTRLPAGVSVTAIFAAAIFSEVRWADPIEVLLGLSGTALWVCVVWWIDGKDFWKWPKNRSQNF